MRQLLIRPTPFVTLLVALVFAMALADRASAGAKPVIACPGQPTTTFHDEAHTAYNDTTRGAEASIQVPINEPDVCTGQKTFTDAYTMWAGYEDHHGGFEDYSRWAQIGFGMDFITSGIHYDVPSDRMISFAQYMRACSPWCKGFPNGPEQYSTYTKVFSAATFGLTYNYENYYREFDSKIVMAVGSHTVLVTPYKDDNWDPSYNRAEYANETGHQADDVWGTASNKMPFSLMKIYDATQTSSFVDRLWMANANPDYWGYGTWTPPDGHLGVKIWTCNGAC